MNGVRRERDASLALPTSLCTSTDIVYKSKYTPYVFVHHHHHHTDDTPIECIHTIHDTRIYTSRRRTPKRPTHDRPTTTRACRRYLARVPRPRASRHTTTTTTRAATNRSSARIFFVRSKNTSSSASRRGRRSRDSFIPSLHRSVGRSVTRIDSDSIVDSFVGFLATARASYEYPCVRSRLSESFSAQRARAVARNPTNEWTIESESILVLVTDRPTDR